MKTTAQLLKELNALGYSDYQIAKRAGVAPSQLSRIHTGQDPRESTRIKIFSAYESIATEKKARTNRA